MAPVLVLAEINLPPLPAWAEAADAIIAPARTDAGQVLIEELDDPRDHLPISPGCTAMGGKATGPATSGRTAGGTERRWLN